MCKLSAKRWFTYFDDFDVEEWEKFRKTGTKEA